MELLAEQLVLLHLTELVEIPVRRRQEQYPQAQVVDMGIVYYIGCLQATK